MEIYAPLADRMGMNRIRDELEDLSFKILNPEARNLVNERLNLIKKKYDDTFVEMSKSFTDLLKKANIKLKNLWT